MPTIEINTADLQELIGKKLTDDELVEALTYAKGEIDAKDGSIIKVEVADTNRPDLWSTEGIARQIRSSLSLEKKKRYSELKLNSSGLKVKVDKNLEGIRPKTVCAVIKDIKITEEVLLQMIQLQEKVCESFGAKRREVAIGVYDYDKIKGNIDYKGYSPKSLKFVPLEFEEELDLNEILEMHPKGKEYKHLLEGKKMYPIFIDSEGNVLSMPPVINSNHTGRVTSETENLFIECSGFDEARLNAALNVMVAAMIDRGATPFTVEIDYSGKKVITPDFKEKHIIVEKDYINSITGLGLSESEIKKLLERAGHKVVVKDGKYEISYASYRNDVMHPVDMIEEVVVNYGFNNIEPLRVEFMTKGEMTKQNKMCSLFANLMIGLGTQEIMNYTLTNVENLDVKMENQSEPLEIENPASLNWSVFRTWLTPGVIEFLSKNTNKEYPQSVFEIGESVVRDDSKDTMSATVMKLAYGTAAKDITFTNAKQALDFLMDSIGKNYTIEESNHDSFIDGRCGRIFVDGKEVGIIGEVHPKVLENWGIKFPVAAFEMNITVLSESN
jgi:phenylalanyl-tRNA synthetase beta chain